MLEAERLVLVTSIGLFESIQRGCLTIDESEMYLFSPYSVSILQEINLNPKIIEIVELGCELEDVQSLIPAKLEANIIELKNQALKLLKDTKTLTADDYRAQKHWLDQNRNKEIQSS